MYHAAPARRCSPSAHRGLTTAAACSAILALIAWAGGCAYPNRGKSLERLGAGLGVMPRGAAFDSPKMRLGTMPFDAWYSTLTPLGVDDLGHHSYVAPGVDNDWGDEVSRGTLYTVQGGFVDIAHVRNAIDLTRFCFDHVSACLYHNTVNLDIVSAEPDVYHVSFNIPEEWQDLSDGEASPETLAEVREVSIQIAGRLAYLMTTWHEVITAFGYKGLGIVTEKPSAFSYDDAISHRIGVTAAMAALQQDANLAHFDTNVTAALYDTLVDLGALPADQVVERAAWAEDVFWEGDQPYLRVVDLGIPGEVLEARPISAQFTPRTWVWPTDAAVAGHRIEALYDVEIEMNINEADAIRGALGREAGPVYPQRDFARLKEHLVRELVRPKRELKTRRGD